MRNKYKIPTLFLLLMIAITACKKEPNAIATDMPIVEAYLMPGHEVTVKVYEQKDLSDTAEYGPAVTGLKLSINDGSKTIQLSETKPGTYTYSDQTFVLSGKSYSLSFTYLTYQVSAQTTVPQKPTGFTSQYSQLYVGSSQPSPGTVDTLNTFKWDNPAGLSHILVFKCLSGKGFPVNTFFGNSRPSDFTFNAEQASGYYISRSAFSYYGEYRVILMSVNKEYSDMLKSTGTTSQNLVNAPTNVINGTGIFTGMQADTLKVTVY